MWESCLNLSYCRYWLLVFPVAEQETRTINCKLNGKDLAAFVFWCRRPTILGSSAKELVIKNVVSASKRLSLTNEHGFLRPYGCILLPFRIWKYFWARPARMCCWIFCNWENRRDVIKGKSNGVYRPSTKMRWCRASWSMSRFREEVFDHDFQWGAQMWAPIPMLTLWYT